MCRGCCDELLEVDVGDAKGLLGLGARRAKSRDQVVGTRDHAHPPAAAAFGRLDHERIADFLGDASRGIFIARPRRPSRE